MDNSSHYVIGWIYLLLQRQKKLCIEDDVEHPVFNNEDNFGMASACDSDEEIGIFPVLEQIYGSEEEIISEDEVWKRTLQYLFSVSSTMINDYSPFDVQTFLEDCWKCKMWEGGFIIKS